MQIQELSLAETDLGRAWISQFDPCDADTARLLINSIILVSNEDLIKSLSDIILKASQGQCSPVAIYPARENTGEPYFGKPGKAPAILHARNKTGSEGMISQLCRDISKASNGKIINSHSPNELIKHKCRLILVVDDILASGSRMSKFVSWLSSDRKVKSWISRKYISFQCVAYAATDAGEKKVLGLKQVPRVHKFIALAHGRTTWSAKQAQDIKALCKKYAQYTSRPQLPYGYKNIFSMIMFSHGFSNTSPAILWAQNQGSWFGPFENRPELAIPEWDALMHSKRSKIESKLLTVFGSNLLRMSNSDALLSISLLMIARKRKITVEFMSDYLEIGFERAKSLLLMCEQYDWILNGRITDKGRSLVRSIQKENIESEVLLDRSCEFYYPSALRSPVD